jgi:hypothetical protein
MPRNFFCPLTEKACVDTRCRQDQCAQLADDEIRKREIQRQELNDPLHREAAIRLLEIRVGWLNSQSAPHYFLPDPKGLRQGPERDAATVWRNKAIDKLLTSPKYAGLVRAAVNAITMGREISWGSFASDDEVDGLFYQVVEHLDDLENL